jgi:hypothetical protein
MMPIPPSPREPPRRRAECQITNERAIAPTAHLERRELGEDLGRQHVGPHGHHLAQLDVRRPERLHVDARLSREDGSAPGVVVVRAPRLCLTDALGVSTTIQRNSNPRGVGGRMATRARLARERPRAREQRVGPARDERADDLREERHRVAEELEEEKRRQTEDRQSERSAASRDGRWRREGARRSVGLGSGDSRF